MAATERRVKKEDGGEESGKKLKEVVQDVYCRLPWLSHGREGKERKIKRNLKILLDYIILLWFCFYL